MRRLAVVVLASVLLAACKADAVVTIDVHDDGSGTVRVRVALDADAVQNAEAGGGKLEDRVRLGDLPAAGWTVSSWKRGRDGGATVTVQKHFADARDLAAVFHELNGKDGPVRGVRLERGRGLFSTEYKLHGTADLSQVTAAVASDPDLVGQLTGQRVDIGRIDQHLSQQLREAFHLRVRLVLPDGSTKEFAPAPGKRVSLDASVSQLDTTRIGFLGAAVVLGALGVFVFVRGERRGRDRRGRGARSSA
jgi:hypothetical protein